MCGKLHGDRSPPGAASPPRKNHRRLSRVRAHIYARPPLEGEEAAFFPWYYRGYTLFPRFLKFPEKKNAKSVEAGLFYLIIIRG